MVEPQHEHRHGSDFGFDRFHHFRGSAPVLPRASLGTVRTNRRCRTAEPDTRLRIFMSSILEKCSFNLCAARRSVRLVLGAVSLLLLLAMIAPSAKAQAPINDNFFNATVLTGAFGATNGTTIGSTFEINEPFHAGHRSHSVWYRWVAPTNGLVTFDTF